LKESIPVLYPLTDEARRSVKCGAIIMDKFPFRIGRQSRTNGNNSLDDKFDRRMPGNSPNNDYYLLDENRPLHISREHFQVEQQEDGTYELLDLGSACGTSVDGHNIGGERKEMRYPVHKGSIVVLGTSGSPYAFKFQLLSE